MTASWMDGWRSHPTDDAPLGGPAAVEVPVDDESRIGEARRAAESLAARAGLGETERGTLAVVVTEAATNLARHARGGRVRLSVRGEPEAAGIELLAVDEGPGIANLNRAFEDGFSTAGTAGQGLGAIRRMAGEFDLYSRAGAATGCGTALVARVWSAAAQRARLAAAARPQVGAVCVPLAGERASGDAWAVFGDGARTLVAVADGLGHGPDAAEAAEAAMRVVHRSPDAAPVALLHAAHAALRATRGAALALVEVDEARGTVVFAGVGNVVAVVLAPDGSARTLASHNGTVGHSMRTVQAFNYEWPAGGTLLLHTDGINTRWRLDTYPGLLRHDPALLAAVLHRDAARGRDDATVVALRGGVG